MRTLPQELYTAEQVRELDRIAIEDRGIEGYALMRRAGRAAYAAMINRWPRSRFVTVCCGSGNNGGDGYVVAALATRAGHSVRVLAAGPPKSGEAVRALHDYTRSGGVVEPLADAAIAHTDVLVDALLGTGLERAVSGSYADAIGLVNENSAPVLAIDIPSGLHSDTGQVMGSAVRADVSVSFIGLKVGLFTGRGPACAGEVLFDDLGVPSDIYEGVAPAAVRLEPDPRVLAALRRPRDAHKGERGRVLIIGGDLGMLGALQLCGEAAYRSGAGLVRLITRPEHAVAANSGCSELLVTATDDGVQLRRALTDADAVAIGPGLGQGDWARSMFSAALEWRGPLVVDADALNLLAVDPTARDDWVLTPHPGEASRLLGVSGADIQRDRSAAVRGIASRFGGVAVLKGAGSLISGPDQSLWVCDRGNPGMAVGGMGDVLTGVVASLSGQGLPLLDAARLGVWLHAAAADCVAGDSGAYGMLASDLYPWLNALLTDLVA